MLFGYIICNLCQKTKKNIRNTIKTTYDYICFLFLTDCFLSKKQFYHNILKNSGEKYIKLYIIRILVKIAIK